MTATHPSDRELDEFLLGKFPDPDHVAVEEHLAGCPGCQAGENGLRERGQGD